MKMTQVLVVDDELGIRNLLSEILEDDGYDVVTAEDASQARKLVQQKRFDLILLDIWMPDTDGVTLLKEWGAAHAITCPVIMMSGHGTIETAMEATRFGAMDFLEKPIALKRLLTTCRSVLEEWQYRHTVGNRMIRAVPPSIQPQKTVPVAPQNIDPKLTISNPKPGWFVVDAEGEMPITGPSARMPVLEVPFLGVVFDDNRSFREMRDDFERAYLTRVLRLKGGSIAALAKHAQLERTHLYRKLRTLGVDVSQFTGSANRDRILPIYGKDNGSDLGSASS